jgi:heparinase II/III-like protein/F5/8 type C domain-containing protein
MIAHHTKVYLLLVAVSLAGSVAAAQENLARLEGVLAIADSQHRDRWGTDGFHPQYVRDGNTDRGAMRASCWASDNWEVTHTLVLLFPRRMTVSGANLHWAQTGGSPSTPTKFSFQGYRDGNWVQLATLAKDKPEAITVIEFEPIEIEAIRLIQPPDGVSPATDRRLWVAEFEVWGVPVAPAIKVDAKQLAARFKAELKALRAKEDAQRIAPALAVVMQERKTRGFTSIIDHDDLARGRNNAATQPWARKLADKIKKDADWWLDQSDDFIHSLVPEGNPRAICPSFEYGCPIHGGARSSFTATIEAPYRWKCKKGGEEWYHGAVIKNPKTGESITVHDDGHGWLAPEGFLKPGVRYYFVGAYRYFLLGKLFHKPYEPDGGSKYTGGSPVVQLALAYALTGDSRYAHKCAVMLNRLAELYPTYDGCVEGPSQRQDGYIGQTFERFLVRNLILAADLIWDEIEQDSQLHRFFAEKGNADYDGDGKLTGGDFTFNLQRNLLGYVYEYLHRLMPYMDGDFLMYEMTALAALAHCLENADLAAETLQSDLGLRVLLTNSWFRDGKYIYDSCGYNVGNARTPLLIGEWMHDFNAPPRFPRPLDPYHHPDYRMSMLFDFLRNVDCDGRVPQIGDAGGSRGKSVRLTPPYSLLDERALVRLPEQRSFYLSRLLAASRGDLDAYRNGRADWWLLFHAEDAPKTAPAGPDPQPSEVASHLFDDSGIAILRAGKDPETRQHVCLTFSRGAYGHGHPDKLAVNLFRHGYDLTADLGYPTTWTDIKCGGWEKATASHCTVMLDERGQRGNVIGSLHYFATEPTCDVVEASARPAYPNATLYRRTVALVRDDQGEPSYTVDIFRVAGATTRDYLFHSLGKPEDLTVKLRDAKATWTRQPKGSLADPDVEPMTQGGYGFLFDVERTKTDHPFTATWRSTSGSSQPDRYLLTGQRFRDFTVEFTIVRTGKASGDRERALFAFCVDPDNVGNRRVAWLDAGGQLPVGKPVRVRIEVEGSRAQTYLDEKLHGRTVDTAGNPADDGVIGFLHYYNYAHQYRDFVLTPKGDQPIRVDFAKPLDHRFWAWIDPTYQAGDGLLLARDFESVGLHLHMLGAPGREVIRAKAEGHGIRGQSPLEGHLVVRDRVDDLAQGTLFAAVIEAPQERPRVTKVESMPVGQPTSASLEACDTVALRVTTIDSQGEPRVDYVISAMDETAEQTIESDLGPIQFKGLFALVATRDKRVASLTLVGGGHLSCGRKRLEMPGAIRGQIVTADVEGDSLVVRLDAGSTVPSKSSLGQKLLVTNPAFVCSSVYTIAGCEPAEQGTCRLKLNMPLTVARGVIKSVDSANGTFATRTPVMKLRVNPGLFNGKWVRAAPGRKAHRLKSATEAAFVLANPAGIHDFAAGREYLVGDVGVGDRIEVIESRTAR